MYCISTREPEMKQTAINITQMYAYKHDMEHVCMFTIKLSI